MRPFWVFRYFVLAGCSTAVLLQLLPVRSRLRFGRMMTSAALTTPVTTFTAAITLTAAIALAAAITIAAITASAATLTRLRLRRELEDLTFEDPTLHADRALFGARRPVPVLDVRAKRVQRNATFAIPLVTRHFRA